MRGRNLRYATRRAIAGDESSPEGKWMPTTPLIESWACGGNNMS